MEEGKKKVCALDEMRNFFSGSKQSNPEKTIRPVECDNCGFEMIKNESGHYECTTCGAVSEFSELS